MVFEMNDRKKIGLGLTGFGILFSFLGILFLFDKGLLAMGNILFLSGVMLTIGLKSNHAFFHETSKLQGYNLLWSWLLSGPHWVAHYRNDLGSIWFHCAVQWILAYIGSVFTKDSYIGMDLPTAIRDIGTEADECLCDDAESMGMQRKLAGLPHCKKYLTENTYYDMVHIVTIQWI